MYLIYWDACVFLSYINGEHGRVEVISQLLTDVASREGTKIVTSAMTKVEVAYGSAEKCGRALDPATEDAIESLWDGYECIVTVEFHDAIALDARGLMRKAIEEGRKLRPMDAIHLATAAWVGAKEFHTYDPRILKYPVAGSYKISEPFVGQSRLPL